MRLAGAVIVPGLTGTPIMVSEFGSLTNWVSLNLTPGSALASKGTVPGGCRRLRRLPELEPLLGQLAEFVDGLVLLARGGCLLEFVEPEIEDVVPIREGADIRQPLAQFQRQGPAVRAKPGTGRTSPPRE